MTDIKICALGSVNLDMIIQTKTLPCAGETIAQGRFESLPGGKGANVALAAQRLGANVELRAAVGGDSYALQALYLLQAGGVDLTRLVKIADSHTGLAFINVADDGENQIAVASGANDKFKPSHLTPISADGIITQFEIPLATIEAAIKGFEGFVAINASPVTDGLERLLPHASLIIVNEGEYEAYKSALSPYDGLLAITLGSEGAKLMKGEELIAEARPPKVEVVDTTGAGDSFAAGLTVALMEGQSPKDALQFACTVGALTATKLGTQTATPSRAEVDSSL
ncbi:ribokinase [Hellea balneolensis]|uniref:ribokinase n=1 Tax=Hellea balneolensis TaxID=287478 RepID=UPI0004094EC1|nr:ribokinase [Hellea balneolensis]